MDLTIFAILTQDGIASGAVYVLLALALVLVFSITRVIFIPIGEFLAFGALTMAALQAGKVPHSATLLLILGLATFAQHVWATLRSPMGQVNRTREVGLSLVKFVIFPAAVFLVSRLAEGSSWPMLAQLLLTFAIVAPMGPMIYRLAFQPLAESPVLVLLIVAVAVHLVLLGVGLVIFGAEGSRTTPFLDAVFNVGSLTISGQSIVVIVTALVLIGALYLYFDRTLSGKALRATAVNRRGARLVGIGTAQAGRLVAVDQQFVERIRIRQVRFDIQAGAHACSMLCAACASLVSATALPLARATAARTAWASTPRQRAHRCWSGRSR
jgi:branched-chain amino acid transport system permease protein